MKKENKKTDKEVILRQKAENLLKKKQSGKTVSLTEADTLKLLYELEVHQIELEMVNEELQLIKDKAEKDAEKYADLYDFAPFGYFTLDIEGRIYELNLNGARMLGKDRSLLLNCNFNLFVTPVTLAYFNDFLRKVLENTTKQTCEVQLVINKNPTIFVHIEGIVSEDKNKCLITVVDITELKEAEKKLLTNQLKLEGEIQKRSKLESLGILAGGIAHDFNNILTGISVDISLLKEILQPKDNDGLNEYLLEVEKSVKQASSLTKQLLTFSKGGTPVKSVVYIEDIIRESSEFAVRGAKSKCYYDFDKDLFPVEVDKGQIEQVIHNIVINAVQSMPNGGKIDITAKNYDNAVFKNPLLEESLKYIKIELKDNGKGILPEHLKNIFDPYFTTKSTGSGLGLAISYSIVKKHGGIIDVNSEAGNGTIFTIYLPSSQKKIIKENNNIMNDNVDFFKTINKILFMDDVENIRRLVLKIFNILNIKAESAKDGKEAIDLYKKSMSKNDKFDIVILDLTIPDGIGGRETLERLKEIDPDIKAIVTSGYSNDEVLSNYKKYGFKAVLAKPFDIEMILKALKEAVE